MKATVLANLHLFSSKQQKALQSATRRDLTPRLFKDMCLEDSGQESCHQGLLSLQHAPRVQ